MGSFRSSLRATNSSGDFRTYGEVLAVAAGIDLDGAVGLAPDDKSGDSYPCVPRPISPSRAGSWLAALLIG